MRCEGTLSLVCQMQSHFMISIFLFAATCIDGDIRLLEGDDYSLYLTEDEIAEYYFVKDEVSRGRVEICMSGQWGTLCNRVWDDIAASVACRQLGFSPHGKLLDGCHILSLSGVKDPLPL